MSEALFKQLVADCGLGVGDDGGASPGAPDDAVGLRMSARDIDFINNCVRGKPPEAAVRCDQSYLYRLVCNQVCGLDVDKLDYIPRDMRALGLASSYDPGVIVQPGLVGVVKGELCFHVKQAFNIYQLFHTRYALHKVIYTHPKAKAVELMVRDALVAANGYFHFDEAIRSPERYLRLDDSVVSLIEFSTDPSLEESRRLLERLRRRDIYRLAYEWTLAAEAPRTPITAESIWRCADSEAAFSPSDVVVSATNLHYGMRDASPVDRVLSFESFSDPEPKPMQGFGAHALTPVAWQEQVVRIYATHSRVRDAIRRAAEKFVQGNHLKTPLPTSPPPVKRQRLNSAASTTAPLRPG